MKTIISALLLTLATGINAQQYNWSFGLGGVNNEFINAVDTDNSGDVYSTGGFQDNMDFDFTNGVFNINAQGPQDIFIQKTTEAGGFDWAKAIGSSGTDVGSDLVVDGDGNIVTVGYFQNAADFDPGTGSFNISPIGTGYNGFILKLNPSGDLIWAKQLGSTGDTYVNSVDTDGSGNIVIAGTFNLETDLDPGIGTDLHTSAINQDGFIAKLDVNGDFLWSHIVEADSTVSLQSVQFDNNGDIGLVGYFENNLNMDPGASGTSYASVGLEDIFLLKLSANGAYMWSEQFGSTGIDYGNDLAFDSNNNFLITGGFGGSLDFDPSPGNFTVNPSGQRDIFTLKLDPSAGFIWIKQAGSSSHSQGEGICIDQFDNIYSTGYFKFNVDFDPGPGQAILDPTLKDVYVQKLTKDGVFIWARQVGGDSDESGYDIALSPSNDLIIGGYFEDSADFDFGPGTIYHFGPGGNSSMFLTQWGNCDSNLTAMSYSACESYLSPAGNIYSSSGFYYDTLSSFFGCDSIVEINLTIINVDLTISESGGTFSANQAGGSYQWINCDAGNSAVAGATQQTFNPTPGVNYAVIIDFNSCTDTTACINLSNAGLITNPLSTLTVYPNPGSDEVYLTAGFELIDQIEIYTMKGELILKSNINKTNGAIAGTAGLDAGIYLISMSNGEYTRQLKWTKL